MKFKSTRQSQIDTFLQPFLKLSSAKTILFTSSLSPMITFCYLPPNTTVQFDHACPCSFLPCLLIRRCMPPVVISLWCRLIAKWRIRDFYTLEKIRSRRSCLKETEPRIGDQKQGNVRGAKVAKKASQKWAISMQLPVGIPEDEINQRFDGTCRLQSADQNDFQEISIAEKVSSLNRESTPWVFSSHIHTHSSSKRSLVQICFSIFWNLLFFFFLQSLMTTKDCLTLFKNHFHSREAQV